MRITQKKLYATITLITRHDTYLTSRLHRTQTRTQASVFDYILWVGGPARPPGKALGWAEGNSTGGIDRRAGGSNE